MYLNGLSHDLCGTQSLPNLASPGFEEVSRLASAKYVYEEMKYCKKLAHETDKI